jgi:hypothetical protein
MTTELYDRVRRKLFGDGHQNALAQLLDDKAAIRGPIQSTPEEFSQILYELTQGELDKRNETVSCEAIAKGNKSVLKFNDGSLFRVVKAKSQLGNALIVVTPHLPSMDDLLEARAMPLSRLVSETLMIQDAYKRVADEYKRGAVKREAGKAVAEHKMARESRLETIVESIEKAKSGETIMVRGQQNIVALVNLGFVPGLLDNPDNWIDAEDFPGMRYSHAGSGHEVLLTGRERFRPVEELNRLEFIFLVNRSDDDPTAFERMIRKFRGYRRDGSPYSPQGFQADLIALVKYPEELKGRTEEDLGLMADEVEHVIDRRQVLDKGILPYEAVFKKDTATIIAAIRKNKTSGREIRKALDYFEYTGMIDPQYKAVLYQQIMDATREQTGAAPPESDDLLHDRRVKEIVAEVLQKIPRERLTSMSITVALSPYVNELGFGRLVKIRDRILQLKKMVHEQ